MDSEQLELEINHILDSGANSIRLMELIVRHTDQELAEQDRRVGELIRKNEYLSDSVSRSEDWLSQAKKDAGFDDSLSFDILWDRALILLKKNNEETISKPVRLLGSITEEEIGEIWHAIGGAPHLFDIDVFMRWMYNGDVPDGLLFAALEIMIVGNLLAKFGFTPDDLSKEKFLPEDDV